jgi:hypothetical protein
VSPEDRISPLVSREQQRVWLNPKLRPTGLAYRLFESPREDVSLKLAMGLRR